MNHMMVPAAIGFCLALTGCSSSDDSQSKKPVTEKLTSDVFSGDWQCDSTENLEFATPAGTPPATRVGGFTLTIEPEDSTHFSSTAHFGTDDCPIHYETSDMTASIVVGQVCHFAGGLTLTYTGGGTELKGDTMDGTALYDFAIDDGPTGTGVATSSCVKL